MRIPAHVNLVVPATLALGVLSLTIPWASRIRGDDKPATPAPAASRLARELNGVWVLAGTPDRPDRHPSAGRRLQFFCGRRWLITEADPETGEVVFHHGGTYTLDGDTLIKAVDYANKNTADLIGTRRTFEVKVENDIYTQIGVGNPFSETWKRAR